MDLKFYLSQLSPQYYGDLTVDDTAGGVGFDSSHLIWNGQPAKVVRATVEGGDFRCKEVGAPTPASGDLYGDGDEILVAGEDAIKNFRAIRTGALDAILRYHVYF